MEKPCVVFGVEPVYDNENLSDFDIINLIAEKKKGLSTALKAFSAVSGVTPDFDIYVVITPVTRCYGVDYTREIRVSANLEAGKQSGLAEILQGFGYVQTPQLG